MRRLIFGVFSSRSSEIAKLAKAASRRGSVPLRMRLWSSRKATSRTQWMRFSIPPVAPVQPQQRRARRRLFRRQAGQQVDGFGLALATVLFGFDLTPQLPPRSAGPGKST